MKDFLFFRSFVSHTLVKIFFYLGLIALIFGYFGMVVYSFVAEGLQAGVAMGVVGFIVMIMYAILLRVSSEMMIIVFQIHDELKELNRRL
jgi:hypothetical protein